MRSPRHVTCVGLRPTGPHDGTARQAPQKSVSGLTKQRVRYVEQHLVAGDAAQALLDTVGPNPANLIVVGNRGLGAVEGQLLGSVLANVAKNATCDVSTAKPG